MQIIKIWGEWWRSFRYPVDGYRLWRLYSNKVWMVIDYGDYTEDGYGADMVRGMVRRYDVDGYRLWRLYRYGAEAWMVIDYGDYIDMVRIWRGWL